MIPPKRAARASLRIIEARLTLCKSKLISSIQENIAISASSYHIRLFMKRHSKPSCN
jgi:hypothetical protein